MRALPIAVATLALLLLAAAGSASAATVGREDPSGSLFFRAADGERNRVEITENAADYVVRDSGPGVTVTPLTGCRDDGDATTENVVLCARPFASGVAIVLLGDGDDEVTSQTGQGFLYRGGEGDDVLRASSTPRSSVTMIGDGGTDTYVPGRPGENFEFVSYSERTTGATFTMDDVANDPDGESVPSTMTGVGGTQGDDRLVGTGKGDYLFGGGGVDRVEGLGGPDNVNGAEGDDVLEGGDGNDRFPADDGADRIAGGEGFDRFEPVTYDFTTGRDRPATVTLDDVANDGRPDERDDVRADVEDVTVMSNSTLSRSTITGDADVNVLRGSFGMDTLDGGAGSDFLDGGSGDDTIRARDGFTDRIQCGTGTDTATVDPEDQVEGCETVDRAALPPPATTTATTSPPPPDDDRPPTVAFSAPGDDALLGTLEPSTITVDAADDRAVSRVLLMDDGRVVGEDSSAPYTFAYRPAGDDVGRNTLVAVAVDDREQTGTAVRPVRVDRFLPGVRAALLPARDRTAPFRFTVRGTVQPPQGVTAAQACGEGRVSVQVKRGTRTISTRRAALTRSCAFSLRVTFRDRRRLGDGRLKATVRFLGNDVLRPRTTPVLRVRAG